MTTRRFRPPSTLASMLAALTLSAGCVDTPTSRNQKETSTRGEPSGAALRQPVAAAQATDFPTEAVANDPTIGLVDLYAHTRLLHVRPEYELDPVDVNGVAVRVQPVSILDLPFAQLFHFEVAGRTERPKVLIVMAAAGQFATAAYDLIQGLLVDHDVSMIEWRDAALVPALHGPFGLDEQIDYIIQLVHRLGSGVHLVAVSQSGIASLAAVSMMAADHDPLRPRSLTLMGTPIDTSAGGDTGGDTGATPIGVVLDDLMLAVTTTTATSDVPLGFPGVGRRVLGAATILASLIELNLTRIDSAANPTPLRGFHAAAVGDGGDAVNYRGLYDKFLSLKDVPAEVYIDTSAVLTNNTLATGKLTWHGRTVDPRAIFDTGLFTIAGERDTAAPAAQVRAAQALCANIPAHKRRDHLEPEVGHVGIFHGIRWHANVLPLVTAFIADNL